MKSVDSSHSYVVHPASSRHLVSQLQPRVDSPNILIVCQTGIMLVPGRRSARGRTVNEVYDVIQSRQEVFSIAENIACTAWHDIWNH